MFALYFLVLLWHNKKFLVLFRFMAGPPTVLGRNTTPIAYPGSPLHLSVEFCANPPAYAARWQHAERIYTPGNQYGSDVLAYGFIVSSKTLFHALFDNISFMGSGMFL